MAHKVETGEMLHTKAQRDIVLPIRDYRFALDNVVTALRDKDNRDDALDELMELSSPQLTVVDFYTITPVFNALSHARMIGRILRTGDIPDGVTYTETVYDDDTRDDEVTFRNIRYRAMRTGRRQYPLYKEVEATSVDGTGRTLYVAKFTKSAQGTRGKGRIHLNSTRDNRTEAIDLGFRQNAKRAHIVRVVNS
ncbi:MAG: hypothetical protein AAB553_07460 [Patescibacteria group bacterium]